MDMVFTDRQQKSIAGSAEPVIHGDSYGSCSRYASRWGDNHSATSLRAIEGNAGVGN